MDFWDELAAIAATGEKVTTVTVLAAPPGQAAAVGQSIVVHADGRVSGQLVDEMFTGLAALAAADEGKRPLARTMDYQGGSYRLFVDTLGADKHRVVILGAGHISQPLAAILTMIDYEVTVVDDRPDFANRQRFPQAAEVICGSFEQVVADLTLDENTAVVVVTRGHRHDLECLRAVIDRPAGYVGMIGSRHKIAGIFDALAEEGIGRPMLSSVKAPIGLDIGADGPAEIALAIAAEIVACFRGGPGGSLSRGGGISG